MSEFSEVFIESLSSELVGEHHLLSECTVLKIPAFINERNDIIVWVFVRKCFLFLFFFSRKTDDAYPTGAPDLCSQVL